MSASHWPQRILMALAAAALYAGAAAHWWMPRAFPG